MAYITYNELLARYPQFQKWHEGNEALVNSFSIYLAEAELNSRLASAFTLPLTATYPVLKDITLDLCYAKMMLGQNPDAYKEFYDGVIDRINRLVNGDDLLVDSTGAATVSADDVSSDIFSTTMDYHATHTMLGADHPYERVSSEHLYDLETARK